MADLIVDPEGDAITWVQGSAPPGFAIWQDGTLVGAGNTTLPDGINEISFKVSDGRNTNTIRMNVNIQPDRANLPPEVIKPIGNIDVEVGKMFRIALREHFREPNGDSIHFGYQGSHPFYPGLDHSQLHPLLGGVPDASWLSGSPHTISLRVRDNSHAYIIHNFTITVTDPQSAPATAVAPAPTTAAVDEITVTASSEKKSGGGSIDAWLLAALLLLTLVAVRRRARVLGVEITIAQQRLPADHIH
jgi:MYXO-CTERM domain-containing protein